MPTSSSNSSSVISVIGLGYVGLPVAVAFANTFPVIGFDVNQRRIHELANGTDANEQIQPSGLKNSNLSFTANAHDLRNANFHIITVPTPVDKGQQPDLSCLIAASQTVGKALKKGDIVIYESTVYPGATEEECVPVLEKNSGLTYNTDFFVGYSPERINPGDTEHTFETIRKVVSGSTPEALEKIAAMYGTVVKAGIHKAPTIKVAEAAKVIENTQRDLNIALMNECAVLFEKLDIDTCDVLAAARTKWNFLPFVPGLVGGHCIGVDPYYLTHKAITVGYHPQVILAGRRINDGMGAFIAERTIKELIRAGQSILGAQATVLGITFKENCKDIRNSKVIDVIHALQGYGMDVQIHDPIADPEEVKHEYGLTLTPWDKLKPAKAIISVVAHDEYKKLSVDNMSDLMTPNPILIDVKALFDGNAFTKRGVRYWRL